MFLSLCNNSFANNLKTCGLARGRHYKLFVNPLTGACALIKMEQVFFTASKCQKQSEILKAASDLEAPVLEFTLWPEQDLGYFISPGENNTVVKTLQSTDNGTKLLSEIENHLYAAIREALGMLIGPYEPLQISVTTQNEMRELFRPLTQSVSSEDRAVGP